jgi:hypothetical protein
LNCSWSLVIGLGQLVGLTPHLTADGELLSMWLLLGPAAVLAGSTLPFALDAVARHWRFTDRARLAALHLGIGIAFQLLALLGVAPVLARLSWHAAARVSWRLVLPSIVVLVLPLVAETHRTIFVLVRQPSRSDTTR